MQVYLVLLQGRNGQEPLFLQIKQAGPAVYEQFLGPSRYPGHGERVIRGKRLIQAASDIFLGWTSVRGFDFYVRQFRDMKVIPSGELIAPYLVPFAERCGHVLARSHARTGDAMAIAGYIGKGRRFDEAMAEFAVAYADRTIRDHQQLVAGWEPDPRRTNSARRGRLPLGEERGEALGQPAGVLEVHEVVRGG
jgi:hypothetical protein